MYGAAQWGKCYHHGCTRLRFLLLWEKNCQNRKNFASGETLNTLEKSGSIFKIVKKSLKLRQILFIIFSYIELNNFIQFS